MKVSPFPIESQRELYYNLGMLQSELGHPAEALETLEKNVKLSTTLTERVGPTASYALGDAYSALGNLQGELGRGGFVSKF